MKKNYVALVILLGWLLQGCASRDKQASQEDLDQIAKKIEMMDEKLSVIMDLMQREAQFSEAERRGMHARSLGVMPDDSGSGVEPTE